MQPLIRTAPLGGLILACAMLTVLPAARAQTTAPADPAAAKVLNTCLAKAGNLEPSCIGLVADACLKTADSTQRMGDCETRELKVWDRWLNRDYAVVMARLPAPAQTQLRDIERAFVADTDRRCGFLSVVNGPTAINTPPQQECRLRATAMQWLWLKAFKG
jgi:uncharacterized protein YecT (DUF1311 family)